MVPQLLKQANAICFGKWYRFGLQISSGVPSQGSILGPILFPIYDNGTQFMSKLICLVLYADDMNVLVSHENVNTLMICGEERTSCSLGLDVKQIDD